MLEDGIEQAGGMIIPCKRIDKRKDLIPVRNMHTAPFRVHKHSHGLLISRLRSLFLSVAITTANWTASSKFGEQGEKSTCRHTKLICTTALTEISFKEVAKILQISRQGMPK